MARKIPIYCVVTLRITTVMSHKSLIVLAFSRWLMWYEQASLYSERSKLFQISLYLELGDNKIRKN